MDKKTQIIKTAIKLFVEQGFEHTPTSQISKEAGVATGTLFHHFKTKEDLINAAYLYVKEQAFGLIDVAPQSDFKTQLKKVWQAGLEWGRNSKMESAFVFKYANSAYISKETKEKGALIFEPFYAMLLRGKKEGHFKPLPDKVIIGVYMAIFKAFLTCTKDGFDVLWDALKK